MDENRPHQERNENLKIDKHSNSGTTRSFTLTSKQALIEGLVIAGLFAALWIWKALQINSLKKEHGKQQEALRNRAKEQLVQSDKYYLKLLAKPYVWAIRPEMMRGNLNQVNLYANDLVKERNFQSIIVANDKGIIVSSTDKKLEGKNISAAVQANYLPTDSTIVTQTSNNLLLLTSPVMGFNSRLGTLLITYAPQKAGF